VDRAAGAPTSFQVGQPERYRPRFSRPIKIGLPDAASIPEFGFTNPVLVDGENGIVAGHGRVLAARKLGMTEVPCIEIATAGRRLHSRAGVLEERRLAQKVRVPMLVLWGMRSGQGSGYDVLKVWRDHADDVRGLGIHSGHFIPEEQPDGMYAALKEFFNV